MQVSNQLSSELMGLGAYVDWHHAWPEVFAWNVALVSIAAAGERRAAQLIAGEARGVLIAIRDMRQGFAKVGNAASNLLIVVRTLGAK